MAAPEAPAKNAGSVNPCCARWEARYLKQKINRDRLRDGILILEGEIRKRDDQILSLQKACDEERARADSEREEKKKESCLRISMESELAALKLKISSSQKGGNSKSGDMDAEVEVNRLKQLLEEERAKVGLLGETVESEKQKALELYKTLGEARSSLKIEKSKYEEAKKKLGVEQQKSLIEKVRADANDRKAVEERCRADGLLKELQEEKQKTQKAIDACNLQSQCDFNAVIRNMQAQISEKAAEVCRLKQIIEEEKLNPHLERDKAGEEKNKAAASLEALENVKNKANNAFKILEPEANKEKQSRNQLEMLQKVVKEARSSLALEKLKYEDAMKKIKIEKQKTHREKMCAVEEKEKSMELKRLAEAHKKMALDERMNAGNLLKALEAEKMKVQTLQKENQALILSCKSAGEVDSVPFSTGTTEWIFSASLELEDAKRELVVVEKPEEADRRALVKGLDSNDLRGQLLEARQKIENLEAELKSGVTTNSRDVGQSVSKELAKISFLEEQLKFEKKRRKHSEQVAKLEKDRNTILHHALHKLRDEFAQILCHIDLLERTFCDGSNFHVDNQKKRSKLCNFHCDSSNSRLPCGGNCDLLSSELPMHSSPSPRDGSDCLIPTVACSQLRMFPRQLSGTKTIPVPLLGDPPRDVLPSSVLCSSTASFSNKQLVGSQGKVDGSLATSATHGEVLESPRRSVELNKRKRIDNVAAVAENSFRGSASEASGRKKIKKVLDEVKSIKCIQLEGQRLQQVMEENLATLHSMLYKLADEQMEGEKSLLYTRKGHSCALHDRFPEKGKPPHEADSTMLQCNDSDEYLGMETLGAPVPVQAALAHGSSDPCKYGGDECLLSQQVADASFDASGEEFMKLLNLDDMADEEKFHMAMERPISPTLPEIVLQFSEGCSVSGSKCFVEGNYSDAILLDTDSGCEPLRSGFRCVETRLAMPKFKKDELEKSKVSMDLMHATGNDFLNFRQHNDASASDMSADQIHGLHKDLQWLEGKVAASNLLDLEPASAEATATMFCVLFSDMDDIRSAVRVFSGTRTCASACFLSSSRNLVAQDILAVLASQKHLLTREKVCILFSCLLQHGCSMALKKAKDLHESDALQKFSSDLHSVLSAVDWRTLFDGLCDLSELVSLVEHFVKCKRVYFLGDVDTELHHAWSSNLDGGRTILTVKASSTTQMVTAGVVLASICTALNQMHYLFEFSFNILHVSNKDPHLVLSILHVFARVCGEKYLSMSRYGVLMGVVKTIVTLIESGSDDVICPGGSTRPCFSPCDGCPFSESSASASDMLSLLLHELDSEILAHELHKNLKASASLLGDVLLCGMNEVGCEIKHGAVSPLPVEEGGSLCSFRYGSILPGFELVNRFCSCTDALSLLELVSSIMVWDWTCNKILPCLFKLLETDTLGTVSSSVVLLLGQLGRLRIEECGYKDDGVEDIKHNLSSFLCRLESLKVQPSFVATTASALLGLYSRSPEEWLQKDAKIPTESCLAEAEDIIKKFLSSLSGEKKLLLSSSHHSGFTSNQAMIQT
ncbi:hypothetical protein Droror1_Dr00022622 [Drosera rotundifolia]